MGVQQTKGRANTRNEGKTRYRGSCNSGHVWRGPIRDSEAQARKDFSSHLIRNHYDALNKKANG